MRSRPATPRGAERDTLPSCAMGRLPRLVEPTLLLLLSSGEGKHGYRLYDESRELAVTNTEVDTGIVYRTLRTLETNGMVTSEWGPGARGPDRRVYKITDAGCRHLEEWADVLEKLCERVGALTDRLRTATSRQ